MAVDGFPISFPLNGVLLEAVFTPQRRQAAGLVGGGRDVVIDRGIPQWKFSGKTRMLNDDETGQVEAFRDKLRGGARFFTLWNPRRQYPLVYMPAGPPTLTRATIGGTFDGHCSLVAIGSSLTPGGVGRDVLTIGEPYALPIGLTLSRGDHIEARQGVNLMHASDFSSGWASETNCTLAPNGTGAPDGTTTAAVMNRTATGAFNMRETIASTASYAGRFVRLQVWLKLGATLSGNVTLGVMDGSGTLQFNATATPSSSVWTRFEVSGQFSVAAATGIRVQVAPTSSPGAANDKLFLWKSILTEVDTETVSLHRVLDTTTLVADSTGTLTARVEPELPSSFTTDALINVYQARGKFRLIDCQVTVQASGRYRPGQATLSAMSTLL